MEPPRTRTGQGRILNRYFGWYNYPGDLKKAEQAMEGELEEWAERFPGKPVIYTEYGADAVPRACILSTKFLLPKNTRFI
jgi:hypothetical protein